MKRVSISLECIKRILRVSVYCMLYILRKELYVWYCQTKFYYKKKSWAPHTILVRLNKLLKIIRDCLE